jgi:sulfonate transport system substrate-binding protein
MGLAIKMRVGGVPEHFNLPWQLAQEYGLLKKRNIDLDWHFYPNGTGAMAKDLENEVLDIAVLLTEGAVNAIVNGLDASILKLYVNSPLIWGIHCAINSPLKNIGDAEKADFAISRFGSGSHLMPLVDAFYRNKMIRKEQFVCVENMKTAVPYLIQNPNTVFYWEKYTTQLHVDSGELKRIGEYLTPWPCFVIVVRNAFLKKHKEAVFTMLDVINFTSAQFMKSPDTAIPMLVERFNMREENAYNWYYATDWNTGYEISTKMLDNVQYILKKTGNIQETVDSESLIKKR